MNKNSLSLKSLSYIRNFLGGLVSLVTRPNITTYHIKFPNKKEVMLHKENEKPYKKSATFSMNFVTNEQKDGIIVTERAMLDLTESKVIEKLTQIAQSK